MATKKKRKEKEEASLFQKIKWLNHHILIWFVKVYNQFQFTSQVPTHKNSSTIL